MRLPEKLAATLQRENDSTLRTRLITHIKPFAQFVAMAFMWIIATWALVALLLFASVQVASYATSRLVMEHAWLLEWASVPTVVTGGLAATLWGLVWTMDDKEPTSMGIIVFAMGIAAILARAYTIGW